MNKPTMADVLTPGEKGVAKIDLFEVSKQESDFSKVRAFQHPGEYVKPGKYGRLTVDDQLMMTDTQMEWDTNRTFCFQAHGEVLIGGLGIGMVLRAVLDPEPSDHSGKITQWYGAPTHVTVVEKSQDVIDLVSPIFKKHIDAGRLTIYCADIFEWKPPKDAKYDVIYMDIWAQLSTDQLADMTKLKRRFARSLNRSNANATMSCWKEGELRYQREREKRAGW